MNQQMTLEYYNHHAQSFIEQTLNVKMLPLYQRFVAKLPDAKQSLSCHSTPHLLDLGCGSGRDALYFAHLGFKVTAIDGSHQMINMAKALHQQNNIDWQCYSFAEVTAAYQACSFSGIWACASLLHVPFNQLATLIEQLLSLLIADGVFYASFKHGDAEHVKDGRFFCDMNEKRWQDIIDNINQNIKYETWITLDNRPDNTTEWFNVLMQPSGG